MKTQLTKFMGILVGIGLTACGGRVANLTPATTALDSKLSCSHLFGEYENNNKRLVELTGERGDKPLHNVGTLLFVSPLFLNLSSAEKEEAESIYLRQQNLEGLLQAKTCPQSDVIEAAKVAAESEATPK